MALKKKQMQQLKATMKRRELRPVSSYQPPATLEISHRERDRITQRNASLLLSIESLIAKTAQELPQMDDSAVEEALIAVIKGEPLPTEEPAQTLAKALQEMGERCSEDTTPDEDWLLALRAILKSVRTHREVSGNRNYLTYVEKFVADAARRLRAQQ